MVWDLIDNEGESIKAQLGVLFHYFSQVKLVFEGLIEVNQFNVRSSWSSKYSLFISNLKLLVRVS